MVSLKLTAEQPWEVSLSVADDPKAVSYVPLVDAQLHLYSTRVPKRS